MVGADVFMRNEFSADGCVNFTRAMIGGQFDCVGGRFENAGDISLLANAITVGADVFLRQGFSAKGEVNLVRANIGGELDCDGGRFESRNGYALNMDSARVGEDIFFRHGFSAAGQINLTRVNVRGNIRFEDCSCEGSGQVAIYLSHAEIGAGLFFRSFRKRDGGGQGLNGLLFLDQTRCRTFSDDRESWPEPGMLVLDGFTYERFHDCEDIGWKTRCDWLRLQVYAHLNILRSQPWQQASKVLRDMGHEDDAREIAVQREVARIRSADTRGIRKIWMIFLGAAVGFGYRPRYALYWSLGFFLLGWLTFAKAYDLGYMAPRDGSIVAYLAANPGKSVPPRYTEFNSFLYAADTFLPIIEMGQDLAWEPSTVRAPDAAPLPTDRSPDSVTARNLAHDFSIGVHRWIYWIEEIVGWVLVSLFIAGMSGVIKKE